MSDIYHGDKSPARPKRSYRDEFILARCNEKLEALIAELRPPVRGCGIDGCPHGEDCANEREPLWLEDI